MKLPLLATLLTTAALLTAAEALPRLEVPHTTEVPEIDGNLRDPAWSRAAVIDGLRPARGRNYQAAIDREPTEIRLLWDQENLYIAFRCVDREIVTDRALKRDGDVYEADACEFFLDADGAGREWFEVQISPLNQLLDTFSTYSGGPGGYTGSLRIKQELLDCAYQTTRDWNAPGMRTAAGRWSRDGLAGWSVEVALPAAAVKRNAWAPGPLRMNFVRYNHGGTVEDAEKRFSNWSPVEHGCPHISPAAMGVVELKAEQ